MQIRPAYRSGAPSGFTLIELMVALSIMAILLAVAAPSFTELWKSTRIRGQANDIMTDLSLARSEAVKRNVPVLLCPSADGATCSGTAWGAGWIIFPDVDRDNTRDDTDDEPVLKRRPVLEGSNTLQSDGHSLNGANAYIAFQPSGVSNATGIELVLCDDRTSANAGRAIEVNLTGRPSSAPATCPKTPKAPHKS